MMMKNDEESNFVSEIPDVFPDVFEGNTTQILIQICKMLIQFGILNCITEAYRISNFFAISIEPLFNNSHAFLIDTVFYISN